MKNENLENQIKNQLEQRSIKPSHDAWQKLESALDDQGIGGDKNRKSNIYYMLLFVLLGGGLYFLVIKMENKSVSDPTEKKAVIAPEAYAQNEPVKVQETLVTANEPQALTPPEINAKAVGDLELGPKPAKMNKKHTKASGQQAIITQTSAKQTLEKNNALIQEGDVAMAQLETESPEIEKAVIDVNDLKLSISLQKRKAIHVSANKLLETAMKEEKSSFFSKVVSKLNRRGQEAITLLSERNLEN
ncbi:MAG TPA: hypothetical protein PKD18_15865 [Saprospiraceae bacterium]|nr:hypothetical protein [Saprospiraceae bacterium]